MISPELIGPAIATTKTILTQIANIHPIFMLAIFGIFVVIAVKTFKTLLKCIYIAVAAVAFPFVMNYVFGMHLSTDMSTLMFFASTGIGFFLAYHTLKMIYKIVSGIAWVGGRLTGSKKPEPAPAVIEEDEME